jgi:hypothetical protein
MRPGKAPIGRRGRRRPPAPSPQRGARRETASTGKITAAGLEHRLAFLARHDGQFLVQLGRRLSETTGRVMSDKVWTEASSPLRESPALKALPGSQSPCDRTPMTQHAHSSGYILSTLLQWCICTTPKKPISASHPRRNGRPHPLGSPGSSQESSRGDYRRLLGKSARVHCVPTPRARHYSHSQTTSVRDSCRCVQSMCVEETALGRKARFAS